MSDWLEGFRIAHFAVINSESDFLLHPHNSFSNNNEMRPIKDKNMAVTERFREIGTMKCLGALDRFILRLFFLEAGMQGLAGAGAGALAGAVFALLNALIRFGTAAITHLLWNSFFVSVFYSIGVGCLLSLVGVFYPALVAAKMQPVEAMRVEQ